jgi:hypothetical protein
MPSPDNQSSANRGIDWKAVARTFLFQVLVLLALAVAFVGYINWSSDAAFEEFVAASKPAAPDSNSHLPSATPVMTVKGKAPCPRKS